MVHLASKGENITLLELKQQVGLLEAFQLISPNQRREHNVHLGWLCHQKLQEKQSFTEQLTTFAQLPKGSDGDELTSYLQALDITA